MDIITSLPAELRCMILGKLHYPDLCRAMSVSKDWKGACLDPTLWRHLKFVKHWSGVSCRPFRKHVFNDIICKRAQGGAKSLTVWDINDFGIRLPVLKAALRVLDRLEFLSLKGLRIDEGCPWTKVLFEEAAPSLKTLHVDFKIHSLGKWPLPSAIPMAQSLEEFSVSSMVYLDFLTEMLCSTVWPMLRKLRVPDVDLVRILPSAQCTSSNHCCRDDLSASHLH